MKLWVISSKPRQMNNLDAPVRLCCGQRHYGPICHDNKVMCALCFERVEQNQLNVTFDGRKEDVC